MFGSLQVSWIDEIHMESADDLAFERAAYASKSFIIALALCRGHLTAEQASQASHVEVRSQIEIWGEVEDSQSTLLWKRDRILTLSPRCRLSRHPPRLG